MNSVFALAFIVAVTAVVAPAHANHKTTTVPFQQPLALVQVDGMTDGEVRKVDKDAKKLTIKHGEIKNLDMPPMTMVFRVKDAGVLDKVKVGDKVRFVVQKSDTGFVVTDIQAAK